jgi:hypothetical protein
MPWYRTNHTLPPSKKEITMWKDGVKTTKEFTLDEIFDGKGGVNENFGPWWTYNPDLPEPPGLDFKGIDYSAPVQEELLDPKIVKGKPAPPGPDLLAEGSLDEK